MKFFLESAGVVSFLAGLSSVDPTTILVSVSALTVGVICIGASKAM